MVLKHMAVGLPHYATGRLRKEAAGLFSEGRRANGGPACVSRWSATSGEVVAMADEDRGIHKVAAEWGLYQVETRLKLGMIAIDDVDIHGGVPFVAWCVMAVAEQVGC